MKQNGILTGAALGLILSVFGHACDSLPDGLPSWSLVGASACPNGGTPFVCNDVPSLGPSVPGYVKEPSSCTDSLECSARPCGIMICAASQSDAINAAAMGAGQQPGTPGQFCAPFAPFSSSTDDMRAAIRAIQISWIAETGGACIGTSNGPCAKLGEPCLSYLDNDNVPADKSCCSSLTCNLGADGMASSGTCCILAGGYCTDDASCCTPFEVCGADGSGPTCCVTTGVYGVCNPDDDLCCNGTVCTQGPNGFECE